VDTKQRIAELAQERNWSNYELAKRSGVQLSTIQNMYHRNYEPTIPTLQALCKAFGISLSQFFAVGELADVTEEQREILSLWNRLSDEQKSIVRALMGNMISEKI
jgi:transcriptional regulator with XRE-family HTH domain